MNFNSPVGSFYFSFSFSFSCSSFSLFTCCNKKVSIDLHIPQRKSSQLMYFGKRWTVEREAADSEPDGTNTVFKLLNRKCCLRDDILERLILSSLLG